MCHIDALFCMLIRFKEDVEMSDGGNSDSDEEDLGDDKSFASVDELDGANWGLFDAPFLTPYQARDVHISSNSQS